MRMTINKGNWSGEEAKISINKKKHTVSLYDGDLILKLRFENKESVVVEHEGQEFCKGFLEADNKTWYLYDHGQEYVRTHENPYAAAAQMAFNLI